MEIILKKDVDRLGSQHDIVTVKSGFARNFLIPQGMAVAATPSAKKVVAEVIKQQSHKAAKAMDEATKIAAKLEGLSIKIGAKAGENGKIFGSVNSIQIADAIQAAGQTVDRKSIHIIRKTASRSWVLTKPRSNCTKKLPQRWNSRLSPIKATSVW